MMDMNKEPIEQAHAVTAYNDQPAVTLESLEEISKRVKESEIDALCDKWRDADTARLWERLNEEVRDSREASRKRRLFWIYC
jgi:hypothetical protein